jgi:hypothetical protein
MAAPWSQVREPTVSRSVRRSGSALSHISLSLALLLSVRSVRSYLLSALVPVGQEVFQPDVG